MALDYRSSRPLMSRVGMSGNARTISGLGTASKWFGLGGYGAAGIGTYLDVEAYNKGLLSGARFTYNTLGTGASIRVGAINPIAGGVVGGSFWMGQQFYDGYMYWATQMSAGINNFNNWISNPARY